MKNLLLLLCALATLSSCKKECDEGYEGRNCTQEKMPTGIFIDRIDVTGFSYYSQNGVSFDVGSGPDIYPVVKYGTSVLYDFRTQYKQDATDGYVYTYTPAQPIAFPANMYSLTSSSFYVELRDDDVISYDVMQSFFFPLYKEGQNFPKVMQLYGAAPYHSQFKYYLYLRYVW